jgi:hypothetical protein
VKTNAHPARFVETACERCSPRAPERSSGPGVNAPKISSGCWLLNVHHPVCSNRTESREHTRRCRLRGRRTTPGAADDTFRPLGSPLRAPVSSPFLERAYPSYCLPSRGCCPLLVVVDFYGPIDARNVLYSGSRGRRIVVSIAGGRHCGYP